MGHGDHFYFKGRPIFKSYDYLADYDLPHTSSINHPFYTDIEYDDSYIGGTSLIIEGKKIKLLTFDIPDNNNSYPISYRIKIVTKGGEI